MRSPRLFPWVVLLSLGMGTSLLLRAQSGPSQSPGQSARDVTIRYVPDAMAVHKVGRSSQTAKRSSIRAFHQSAYLYYATHVAPGVLNPRRLLARALLGARCWWQLRRVTG